MANGRRVFRVAEKIRELIAHELLRVGDPRFALVTITSVQVTSDLREAKVYWNVADADQRCVEVESAFDAAGGHFRHCLGQRLGLRFVPRIRFYYDDTLDTIEEVEQLIKRATAQRQE